MQVSFILQGYDNCFAMDALPDATWAKYTMKKYKLNICTSNYDQSHNNEHNLWLISQHSNTLLVRYQQHKQLTVVEFCCRFP